MKKILLICLTSAALWASAAAQGNGRIAVFLGPRFGGVWYGSFWGPYPSAFYDGYYAPPTGDVKIDTDVKEAELYIDGAYAGTVGKLKTIHLHAGSYNIELRALGRAQYARKIYVIAGKTLHLNPDLRVEPQPTGQPQP